MAEAVLGAVCGILISLAKTELRVAWGVKTEVSKLSTALTSIQAVDFADAEVKQIRNKAVEKWLTKLKHAAYDAQDVFDDLAVHDLELLQPDPPVENCRDLVWISLHSLFINLKRFIPHYMIANKIKPIRERFDRIVEEMSKFDLITRVVDREGQATTVPPPSIFSNRETSSRLPGHQIYGRDDDKKKIVKMLLDNVNSEDRISVCPILGMGGIGKTTLAQYVYNDDTVEKHFHLKIWICVSDDFDVKRLLKSILKKITDESRFENADLDLIQNGVEEKLKDKRFLIVFDDVWDHSQWHSLKNSLKSGAKGSSIIVTTRSEKVASITRTISEPYRLKDLSEDHCLSLLRYYAFDGGKISELIRWESIGRDIIRKCGGSPLAAKVLGSLLRFKYKEEQWEQIRSSEIWELEDEILPALRLSYVNLSPRARQCFACCSLFPKDYDMSKDMLVFIWLGNGLLEVENKEPEDVGEDVFIELKLHSFFQDIDEDVENNYITFTIHDLLHDLASSVMKRELKKYVVEVGEVRNKINYCVIPDSETRFRHMTFTLLPSLQSSSRDDSRIHPSNSSQQFPLRTLLLFSNYDKDLILSAQDVSAFSHLKNLRVLWIERWSIEIESLPVPFGDKLRHLTYLNLSGCSISSLPTEFFRGMKNLKILDLSTNPNLSTLPALTGKYLEHLEHLNLSSCKFTSLPAEFFNWTKTLKFLNLCHNNMQIPDSIGNLVRLRHLNLSINRALVVLPESLGNLTELKKLDVRRCWKLKELPKSINKLCNLRELDTFNCWGLTGMPSGVGQHLSRLENLSLWVVGDNIEELRGLNLLRGCLEVCIRSNHDSFHPQEQEEVLTNKNSLSKLQIWFEGDGVDVNGNFHEQVLRVLKPPSNIEELDIEHYGGKRFPKWMEMRDPRSSFPRLRSIRLSDMGFVEEWGLHWNHSECLPALQQLRISGFCMLKALPEELGNLTSLEFLAILCCSKLVSMPQLQLMTSLKKLEIVRCPQLKLVFNGLRHLTSLHSLYITECPGVVIPKGELDALVALRGSSIFIGVDKELIIHEDQDSTISGTRGEQALQVPIHDHQEDYSRSITNSEINRIRKGKQVLLQLPIHEDNDDYDD